MLINTEASVCKQHVTVVELVGLVLFKVLNLFSVCGTFFSHQTNTNRWFSLHLCVVFQHIIILTNRVKSPF